MKRLTKAFIAGLALVLVILVPACRKKVKVVDHPPVETMATVPDVAPTVTREETAVKQDEDFVRDEKPAEEPFPTDIEKMNQLAQDRGFIRDAFYNYDESTLSADAQSALTASANWLRANPTYKLLIEGHCDERGTEQYNLALGDGRANTAREFLMTLGIDGSRIRTVSYGEERPFDEGHDESAWSKNRRAHLVLVK